MRDLTSVAAIKLKGALFLFLGILSAALILLEVASWRLAVLLVICIWAFCRAYYFAFYVIEKYVDPQYKFSGLGSAVKYLISRSDRRK